MKQQLSALYEGTITMGTASDNTDVTVMPIWICLITPALTLTLILIQTPTLAR